MEDQQAYIKTHIRDIPDWPKEGILFRDITPLLADAKVFFDPCLCVARLRGQTHSFDLELFVVTFSHDDTPPVASYILAVRCVHYFGKGHSISH